MTSRQWAPLSNEMYKHAMEGVLAEFMSSLRDGSVSSRCVHLLSSELLRSDIYDIREYADKEMIFGNCAVDVEGDICSRAPGRVWIMREPYPMILRGEDSFVVYVPVERSEAVFAETIPQMFWDGARVVDWFKSSAVNDDVSACRRLRAYSIQVEVIKDRIAERELVGKGRPNNYQSSEVVLFLADIIKQSPYISDSRLCRHYFDFFVNIGMKKPSISSYRRAKSKAVKVTPPGRLLPR